MNSAVWGNLKQSFLESTEWGQFPLHATKIEKNIKHKRFFPFYIIFFNPKQTNSYLLDKSFPLLCFALRSVYTNFAPNFKLKPLAE